MTIKKSFKKFYAHLPRNEVEKAIEFFAVFEGSQPFFSIDFHLSLSQNILHLLENYEDIEKRMDFEEKHLLSTFAIGDRKIDNAIRKSFVKEREGYRHLENLLRQNIIKKEYSREKIPPKTHPKQKRKKELRNYKIQNKVKFSKPFYRFWFRYIYPAKDLLEQREYHKVLDFIMNDIENYISLIFEDLSNELLKERFPNYLSSGSYWDRRVELDLLLELENGKIVVGECKWKNSKICKKTLTSLQKKSKIAGIEADYFALFSKSSFSNELLKSKERNLLLFDLEDFKEWSSEKSYRKREKKPYSFEF